MSSATNLPRGKSEISQVSGCLDKDQTMLSKCSTQIETRALSFNPSSNLSIGENILPPHSCNKNPQMQPLNTDDDNDSFGEVDESINENKEEIETLAMKSNMSSGVLTAARNLYFNNKIKQFNAEKNFQPFSTRATKESYRSLLDQSNKPQVLTCRMEKIGTGLLISPRNQPRSPQPKQRSFNELDDMFDEIFSDDDEEDKEKYDELDATQKIIPGEIPQSVVIKEKVHRIRSNKKYGTTVVGMIRVHDEDNQEAVVGQNVLDGLQDDENSYISAEKKQQRKAHTFEDMEDYSYAEILTRGIFQHDLSIIRKVLRKREFPINLNMPDALGNTPLMLAVKLS